MVEEFQKLSKPEYNTEPFRIFRFLRTQGQVLSFVELVCYWEVFPAYEGEARHRKIQEA
jgi:hypothetical protein